MRSTILRRAVAAAAVAAVAALPAPWVSADELTGLDEPVEELAPRPVLPPGVDVLLNGVGIGDDHGSRIDGCELVVGVDGLAGPEAPPVAVRVQISAIPPTVDEGSRETVLDEVHAITTVAWTQTYPMEALLSSYEQKTNGYRLAVVVWVEGEDFGPRELWLGCGAPQTGHPNRVIIEKVWIAPDGSAVEGDLDDVLPTGWRDAFRIQGTSRRGSAVCTYPPGSDELVCVYDNPGHGTKPGLVVPEGKQHTYEIVELGVPEGWDVDPATVGTFLGRETCGHEGCGGDDHDGGSGHDGGSCGGDHADAATLSALSVADDGADGAPCVHQVRNLQRVVAPVEPDPPVEPEPPAEPPPSSEPAVEDPVGDVPPEVGGITVEPTTPVASVAGIRQVPTQTLPATGASHGRMLTIGSALTGLGAVALVAGRAAFDQAENQRARPDRPLQRGREGEQEGYRFADVFRWVEIVLDQRHRERHEEPQPGLAHDVGQDCGERMMRPEPLGPA